MQVVRVVVGSFAGAVTADAGRRREAADANARYVARIDRRRLPKRKPRPGATPSDDETLYGLTAANFFKNRLRKIGKMIACGSLSPV